MAEECHPEFTHASFSQLGRFIRGVDRKIGDMLEDFRAEGNEMSWVLEALRNNQENLKRRLRDVICTIFEKNNEDELIVGGRNSEECVELVEALARFFWKKEEQIDGRMNKCYELLGEVQCQKAEEESKHATGLDQTKYPLKTEEEQETDAIDLKRSRKERRVEVKGPSMAEKNLEAALSRTSESFFELTCFTRRVDRRIESLKRNFKQNGDESEMAWAVEDIKDWQESLKARLNELTENYFKAGNEDEILEVAVSSEEPVLLLASMLQSLMKEEQEIEFWVNRCSASSDCGELFGKAGGEKAKESGEPDRGKYDPEEKMNCVTDETKAGSEGDQSSASDTSHCDFPDLGELVDRRCAKISDLNITEKGAKSVDKQRDAQLQMDNILKSLQKHIADELNCQATKIKIEVTLKLVELFLLLSTNRRGSKFQAFKSCLENIEAEKSDTKVVKSILEMLNVADKEFSKVKRSRPREETDRSPNTDDDKQLQEADKIVEELLHRFINLIAHLEALMRSLGHLESRVLAEEAIRGFEKGVKDMDREVQDIESNMELLRGKFGQFKRNQAHCGRVRRQHSFPEWQTHCKAMLDVQLTLETTSSKLVA